jgi:demethylmenaquinone methyltransferase/2-methoxy-6-polyprenyl-1,4-benzoquinol methylase
MNDAAVKIKDGPSRTSVWQMFDRISARYDLLNHLLSFGQDIRWRKKMLRFIPEKDAPEVLDIATGTGDQAISIVRARPGIRHVTGIDLAKMMLEKGREKINKLGLSDRIVLKEGDACALKFSDGSFDLATISFGIRNVEDLDRALGEIFRVLRPGGKLLVLEFSLPSNSVIRSFYLFYFRYILPLLGGIISGDRSAYRYLNRTVETFPFGSDFCNFLERAGFVEVTARPLTFGVATIYQGRREEV